MFGGEAGVVPNGNQSSLRDIRSMSKPQRIFQELAKGINAQSPRRLLVEPGW